MINHSYQESLDYAYNINNKLKNVFLYIIIVYNDNTTSNR